MSERERYPAGVPCWVDTWQPDAARAAAFYREIFGWEVLEGPDYAMCRLRGRDIAGIGTPVPDGAPVVWTTYVRVASANETAARAAEAGGQVLAEPFETLDGGRIAILADPSGAAIGAWEAGEHSGAQIVNEPSAWAMSLLSTRDQEAAAAFYRALFGWESEPFAGGVMLFRLPGYVGGEPEQPVPRDVVAAMAPAAHGEPRWDVDFWIADADAAAAKAAAEGGKVVAGPFDQPPFRRVVLADPAGATFSVSELRI